MNKLFYCNVDDINSNVIMLSEMGRFIYGKEVINLLNNSEIL